MTPSIRLATPEDRPAVEVVVAAAYQPYVPRMGRRPAPMLDDYAALIRAGRVHVAGGAGVVLGVLVLLEEPEAMLLDNVAVAPTEQGNGIGRALLMFAEDAARAAGYRSIRLYTNAAMTENIAQYIRIGYIETHRGEELGFRRVYMRKSLET